MNQKPNFLFLFSDQHRGDWMPYDPEVKANFGVEGLEFYTPNIHGMMRRGTTFTRAFTPAPVCAPARACLASGRRYKNCRVPSNKNNYDPNLGTFYNALQKGGYYVCGTGKFDLNKADLDWGDGYHEVLQRAGFTFARDNEGKMDAVMAAERGKPGPYGKMLQKEGWLEAHAKDMRGRKNSPEPTPLPDKLYADNWVAENAVKMLQDAPADRPWFMQVNFSGPHSPWDITHSMKEAMAGRTFPDAVDCSFTEANRGVRQNYAAMIENIDCRIGELIAAVEERGELANTVLVYSSDHGEMMGDHSLYEKMSPYQGAVHIPMVIDASHVGGICGQYNHTPVELQDLAATFVDLAGLPAESGWESESLKPVLTGERDRVRQCAISELIIPNATGLVNTFGMVCDGTYKLIMRKGEADELYNIAEDPFECRNIAKEHPETVRALTAAFAER